MVPKVYYLLANMPVGTLFEVPFGIKDGLYSFGGEFDASQMFAQVIHHKQLMGGYISRLDNKTVKYFTFISGDLPACRKYSEKFNL